MGVESDSARHEVGPAVRVALFLFACLAGCQKVADPNGNQAPEHSRLLAPSKKPW
jgi:hypothetical protein